MALTGKWPPRPLQSAVGSDTSVLAGWKGMTHSGLWAVQGIPSQVPSCQKESKTQSTETATTGEEPGGTWGSPGRRPG